jgi:hypothetical protein
VKKTIVAASLAALIAGGITAEAAKHHANPATKCAAPRGFTLAGSRDGRVYTAEMKPKGGASRTAVYACRYKTGKRFLLTVAKTRLGDDPNPDLSIAARYIREIQLADSDYGPRVAYVLSDCTDTCTSKVVVRSLGTGKTLLSRKAGGGFDQIALSQGQSRFKLGWIETSYDGTCEQGCRVHVVTTKADKVLAEGTDIDPEVFGVTNGESPGIVYSSNASWFVYKVGDTFKVASAD